MVSSGHLAPQSPYASVCHRSFLRAAGLRSPPHRTALALPAFWGDISLSLCPHVRYTDVVLQTGIALGEEHLPYKNGH